MSGCALIALVAFVATQFMPASAAAPAANGASYGGPSVRFDLHTNVQAADVEQPMDLEIDLTDGRNGLPADDFVPDHDALVHLFVISADRGFFEHIYPARTAPGHYVATFTPDRTGEHTAYVEVVRPDGGMQVVAQRFWVNGARGSAVRGASDLSVGLTTSPSDIRAAQPVALNFTFSANGQAVKLAPHLGGAGELIAANDAGTIFNHTPAIQPASVGGFNLPTDSAPTAVPVGDTVNFTCAFPTPGHYTLWAEVKRADTGRVVVAPLSVDVGP
jgi:hypothetical protein